MSKILWDQTGERFYETGVDHGVLYPYANGAYGNGVAWNGLTQVSEKPEGAEPTDLWADNIKYLTLLSTETFKATIEAYMYPDEFAACNGESELGTGVSIGQQKRIPFGLCYRTKIGNDVDPEKGYKIHLIYGALAAPSEKGYATVNDSPEAITFSWEISTTPIEVPGLKPTASLVIDSTKVDPDKLTAIENALYGTDAVEADQEHGIEAAEATTPKLLTPAEIIEILSENSEVSG